MLKLRKPSIMEVLLYLDIIGCIYCIIKSFVVIKYSFWILPLFYVIFFLLTPINRKISKNNLGSFILNFTMSIRYVLIPVIYYSTRELSRFAKNYNHLEQALYLMLFEMVILMIVLELTARHYHKKYIDYFNIRDNNERYYIHLKHGKIITIFIISIILFLGIFYKNLVAGFNVIITGTLEQSINTVNSNILDIIWEVLCVWLYMYCIMKEAELYQKDKKNIRFTYVILYTFVFILITFIQSVAFSRWYTIISAGASIACLFKLFPQFKKKVIIFILIPAILLIILITTYKNTNFSNGGITFTESLISIFSASNFDSYFAGPVNVNNAINVKESYNNLGLFTIFRDMLNNMPIVNHFIDKTKTTVYAYNESIGRLWGGSGDQIMPLVGQSIIYFGYLFAPLMGSLTIWMVRRFDYLYKISQKYTMYIYAFTAIWCSVEAMMLNFTININWFYIRIIPFSIILIITNKIAIKQKGENLNDSKS